MSEPIIGVNIEDHHISAGLVDIETRKVVSNSVVRKKVDPMGSAEQISAAWSNVVKDIAKTSKKVGIGLPGECDYDEGILLLNDAARYNSLYKRNLKEIFSNAIDSSASNVKLVNDAACFLQGEVFGGAGRGFKSSLGVTLGIGLGTAIYSNGIVKDADLHSSSFKTGVAEDFISVRWLLARYKEISGVSVKSLFELKQLADNDDKVLQTFEEFSLNLSQFLITFINSNNPEVVVIGGYMETCNRFFFDSLTTKILAAGIKIPVLRAILGEQASIIGAASTWYNAAPIHV